MDASAIEDLLKIANQLAAGTSCSDSAWEQCMAALLSAITHQADAAEQVLMRNDTECLIRVLTVRPESETAQKCLVNMAASLAGARLLLSGGGNISFHLVEQLLNPECTGADLAGRALLNLSRETDLAELLLEKLEEKSQADSTIDRLAHAVCLPGYNRRGCSLDSAAGLLQNIAQLPATRRRLVAHGNGAGVVGRIAGCLASPALAALSTDRRRYLFGLLKNLCFSSELHPILCSPQAGLVVALATPLAGPDDVIDDEDMAQLLPGLQYLPGSPDAVRGDEWTLTCCLDALLLLCASPTGRDHLKQCKVYFILRELHKFPGLAPRIRLATERVVDVLIADDPISGDLHETPVPQEVAQRLSASDAVICADAVHD